MKLKGELFDTRRDPENLLPGLVQAVNDLGTIASKIQNILHTGHGVQQLGANPVQITNGNQPRLSTSAGKLAGYSVREVAGAPAIFRLRDAGQDGISGDMIMTVSLAANESDKEWFLPQGISFGNGLYFELVSGTIEGVVFLAGRS